MSDIEETYERVWEQAQDAQHDLKGAQQQHDSALQHYLQELEYHRIVTRLAALEYESQTLKAHYHQEASDTAARVYKARSMYDSCCYKLEQEILYQRAFDSAVAAMKKLKEEESEDVSDNDSDA